MGRSRRRWNPDFAGFPEAHPANDLANRSVISYVSNMTQNPTIPIAFPVEILQRADAIRAKADRIPALAIARRSRLPFSGSPFFGASNFSKRK